MYKRDNKTKKAFDDLKKNYGHDNVKVEMYLVAMGHNIRQYHKLKMKQRQKDQKNIQIIYKMIFLGASKI